MTRHVATLLFLTLASIAASGCGREESKPLSASECRQMLDKQRTLLAPRLGGMLEGAVVTQALEVLAEGGPGRMVSFGYSDDEAFAVGLTCGGTIHLFLEPLDW